MYDAIIGIFLKNNTKEVWRPLYGMGTALQEKGLGSISSILLEMSAHHEPNFGGTWNNLGISYRSARMDEKAERAFRMAAELMPDDPNPPSNVSGLIINTGRSSEVVEWADKALKINPDHQQSRWHKALGLLEMQKWPDAWPLHEARLAEGSNCRMAHRNYHGDKETPLWDGKTKGRVVIHGEQGLGDEIMFASCLQDAAATGSELIVECAPRNENLFKRSFPNVRVVGTHKTDGMEWIPELGLPDFKSALGTLPKFYRTSERMFPKKVYLQADPLKRKYWRSELDSLGKWPKVGIAWQGGHHSTRVDLRSLHLPSLSLVFQQRANFVSLQYTKAAAGEIAELKKTQGLTIHHWPKAAEADDMEELAALIAELDLVITVCQTAVHIAGGIGTPCWVMTPSAPAWRYATTGREDMAWYGSHLKLIRQRPGEDWGPVIETVAKGLDSWLVERKAA